MHRFGCVNFVLRKLYSLLRVIFLSVWFYYLPLLFVVFATVWPVTNYLEEYKKCSALAVNDCIGSISTQCIEICRSNPNYTLPEELRFAASATPWKIPLPLPN